MKGNKVDAAGHRRFRLSYFLLVIAAVYLVSIAFRIPGLLDIASRLNGDDYNFISGVGPNDKLRKPSIILIYRRQIGDIQNLEVQTVSGKESKEGLRLRSQLVKPLGHQYGRVTSGRNRTSELSPLEIMADKAWSLGLKAWEEVENYNIGDYVKETSAFEGRPEDCPSFISKTKEDLVNGNYILFLPCGLAIGSSITVVGTPYFALDQEFVTQLAKVRKSDSFVMISQFNLQLQGLKSMEGDAPPIILHLNLRLTRYRASQRLVIEHNTRHKNQWGKAQICDGSPSKDDEYMLVDGNRKCEKWMQNDVEHPKLSKSFWFQRFIIHRQEPEVTWPFPFTEGKLFILTIRAGIEGYHINVGGRHISSFPYRSGFVLKDAINLRVQGDVDLHSVYVTSLPTSNPTSFSSQRKLEISEKWKAQPLNKKSIKLFIGVISATNHFSKRMAVRKTWMQYPEVKSSDVVVRFFVALSEKKEVNVVLKKEASHFGDIVILPYLDRYELVVLKTIAICEYGVENVTAKYIMKCDDDTFIKLDTLLRWINTIPPERSLYMGKLNYLIRPVREGKWAITYQEWPEEVFPPFANGPGYIISNDIAKFVTHQHNEQSLRLFKLEDVGMGMWVQQFNNSERGVQYSHNWKFCQYGCKRGCFVAHYQSPKQMLCLWDNLVKDHIVCCNVT